MGKTRLYIGTSGWNYKHWMGIFYPEKMAGADLLAFYAEYYPTVEINNSYYRLPDKSRFETWRCETPKDFLFAVKASRYITHMKKLKVSREPLKRLMNHACGLEDKMGPVLFQFPHNWKRNAERLEGFLQTLSDYPDQRYAFEFRHESWLSKDTYRLLEKAGAALCLPIHPDMPREMRLTTNWSYLRFHAGQHGTGFTDDELRDWAGNITSFMQEEADVYAYFNNDPEGHA